MHNAENRMVASENCDAVIYAEYEHENEEYANMARDYQNVLMEFDKLEARNKLLEAVLEAAEVVCALNWCIEAHGPHRRLYEAIAATKGKDEKA